MNPESFESHLVAIEKFIENTEKTAKNLSRISIKQMSDTVNRLLKCEKIEENGFVSKALRIWRDESLTIEPSKLGLFAFKRKVSSKSQKNTEHKVQCIDKEEVLEISSTSEQECETNDDEFPEWVKLTKTYWQEGYSKFNPDLLFNPITTPNGKGFVCNLHEIFPKKNIRNSIRSTAAVKW